MKLVIRILLLAVGAALVGCSSGGGASGSKFATALSRFLEPSGSIQKFNNQTGAAIIGAGLSGASDSASINTTSTSWGSTFGALRAGLTLDAKADGAADCAAFAGCVQGDPCLGDETSWTVDMACFCGVAQQSGYQCQGSGTMTQAWSLSVSGSCFEGSIDYSFTNAMLQTADGGFTADGTYSFAMNGCGANQAALAAGDLTSGCMIAVYDLTFDGEQDRAGLKWCAASDAASASQRLEVLARLPDDPSQELVLAVGETYTKDDYGNLSFSSGTIEVQGADGSLVCTVEAGAGGSSSYTGTCQNPDTGTSFSLDDGAASATPEGGSSS